mmetsp:Transcript_37560/g.83640  ORF Transcript_37560/g.83640 Transcript_37560/m.83640 type:complete len:205 (-) Transcript_37560:128-742(-)
MSDPLSLQGVMHMTTVRQTRQAPLQDWVVLLRMGTLSVQAHVSNSCTHLRLPSSAFHTDGPQRCLVHLLQQADLGNQGAGSVGLVLPGGWQLASGLVVPSKAVHLGLHQDQAELGVLVLAVALQVLPDGNGLLDQGVQVLGNLWGKTSCLQDTQNLAASDGAGQRHSMVITQQDTNLAGLQTLTGQLADDLLHLLGSLLAPGRG